MLHAYTYIVWTGGIFGGLVNLCYTASDVALPLLHCIVHFEPIHDCISASARP